MRAWKPDGSIGGASRTFLGSVCREASVGAHEGAKARWLCAAGALVMGAGAEDERPARALGAGDERRARALEMSVRWVVSVSASAFTHAVAGTMTNPLSPQPPLSCSQRRTHGTGFPPTASKSGHHTAWLHKNGRHSSPPVRRKCKCHRLSTPT